MRIQAEGVRPHERTRALQVESEWDLILKRVEKKCRKGPESEHSRTLLKKETPEL